MRSSASYDVAELGWPFGLLICHHYVSYASCGVTSKGPPTLPTAAESRPQLLSEVVFVRESRYCACGP